MLDMDSLGVPRCVLLPHAGAFAIRLEELPQDHRFFRRGKCGLLSAGEQEDGQIDTLWNPQCSLVEQIEIPFQQNLELSGLALVLRLERMLVTESLVIKDEAVAVSAFIKRCHSVALSLPRPSQNLPKT